MDGLAQHVVDACGEQAERVVKRLTLVEAEHRRVGPLPDHPRQRFALAAVADQEGFDRVHVGVADLADPFAELRGLDPGRGYALAIKTGCVAACHDIAIVDDDVHTPAPTEPKPSYAHLTKHGRLLV